MANTLDSFGKWLLLALEKKGWSQADLARAAHISRGTISDVISGRRRVGKDMATSIADALKLPPEQVFRQAGILPPENKDPWVDEMAYKLQQLSPGLRGVATKFIDSMLDAEEAERRTLSQTKPRSVKA